jgi:hypothetical protein
MIPKICYMIHTLQRLGNTPALSPLQTYLFGSWKAMTFIMDSMIFVKNRLRRYLNHGDLRMPAAAQFLCVEYFDLVFFDADEQLILELTKHS